MIVIFAHSSFMLKAYFFIRANGAWVVVEHTQRDTPQVEFGECVTKDDIHRIRATAFAPIFSFADEDGKERLTRSPTDHVQPQTPKKFIFIQCANREEEISGRNFFNCLLHPFLNGFS